MRRLLRDNQAKRDNELVCVCVCVCACVCVQGELAHRNRFLFLYLVLEQRSRPPSQVQEAKDGVNKYKKDNPGHRSPCTTEHVHS